MTTLPRKHCPATYLKTVTRYGSKQDMYILRTPCTSPPQTSGWCKLHQHARELLDWGARLGYPRVQVNDALWIAAGRANWEAYACIYPMGQREQVMRAVGALFKEKVCGNETFT